MEPMAEEMQNKLDLSYRDDPELTQQELLGMAEINFMNAAEILPMLKSYPIFMIALSQLRAGMRR